MDLEDFDFEILKKRIKNEADRKIFAKVFDSATIKVIHDLASKELFDVVEHVISTGKEAHVFVASTLSGDKRAIKIFKTLTANFNRMNEYIEGDVRFKKIRKERRQFIFSWTKKEYKNLLIASKAYLSTPIPLGYKDNVLVLEYIGEGENASPKLKELKPTKQDIENYYEQFVDFVAKLYLAGLVQADLSEYNILVKDKKLVFIDFAQAVLLNHPRAKEFYERDLKHMAIYFTKNGLKNSFDELYQDVKDRKEELEKNMG